MVLIPLLSVLYKQDTPTGETTVFLDPNTLSTDGTVSLRRFEFYEGFSDDGTLLAYGISESGSDWKKIKVRDVETGQDFPELLENLKFSKISWTHDNKGFFYSVSIGYFHSFKIFKPHLYFCTTIALPKSR